MIISAPHYEIYEGTGWEAGVRVREVQGFSLDEDNVLLDNGGWGEYVQYASKTLTDGELVEVIRGGDKAADQWLAVFPEDAPEKISNRMEVESDEY